MGRLSLYFHTLRYMKPSQVYYRLKRSFGLTCSLGCKAGAMKTGQSAPIASLEELDFDPVFLARFSPDELLSDQVTFLHKSRTVDWKKWNYEEETALWNFNLHYFEFLFSLVAAYRSTGHTEYFEKSKKCIQCWIDNNQQGNGGAGWASYVIANRTRYKRMQIRLSWKWNKQTKEATFSYAIPAFVSGLFVMPVHWIGNAMLTRTSGFSEMAVFTIANQWMQYIIYIPAQMGQMRPIYTELFVKKDLNTLRKLMIRITLMTTAAACCISAIVILARNLILPLYGSGYIVGETTFSFMIVAAILYTAQVQTGFMLQAMSKMWISVAINGLWGIALICSYSMMLNQGAVGYSLAYCVAYSITLIIQVMLMIRYLWMKKAID